MLVTPSGEQPRIAGRYLLLEKIGAGGMATVYRALDETTGRVVALKQLASAVPEGRRKTADALFEREYHTLVRLKHPRIIEVYDYGLTEAGRYYTMELLDGTDLNQLGAQPHLEACRLLRDVASSLALMHAHRLVHRDVSPRNIRLTRDGRPKLIDFGAISPFGIAEDVIGTPLCMAPELLHSQPLDQRTDLYSLGIVAYWLLTGRHAYPARRIQDLLMIWETPPVPPSQLVKEIPPELDALVLSLMSLDPIGRPPNAAAVIDQLTAIAGLEPEEHEHAAESYLLSSRMVGRQTELEWVDKRVKRALARRGATVVIEGAPGIGKTRLLREAGVAARLRGAVYLKADAQATPEPFGLAAALSVELLDACPDLARRAAGEDVGLLAHLSPQLRGRFGQVPAANVPVDANERRARFQTALHRWFADVLRERVLFVAVDNVQSADENSAAFLAALGRESSRAQLVLVVTLRTGERLVAEAAVRMMRQRSSRLKLAGLTAESCEQLVKSLFGDVPNSGRAARLLFERSAGVPQQCMDLAQLLVKKQIAKYGGGTWILPQDVAPEELPSRAEELLSARLAGLSRSARRLAEALSIHSKPVNLERCLALLEGTSESETYAALDELVAEQILRAEAGSYRFAHEALRCAVAENLDEARRRASHARAAEVLLASDPDGMAARIEAALHLLDANEESRGAEMLAKLGMGLLGAVDFNAGSEAVLALERALECFERQGRSDYEKAALLFPMMKLAYYSPHWRIIHKYGERTLDIGMRITGLSAAQRLRPFFRPQLALKLGLTLGAKRFAEQQRRGLGYDHRTAIVASCASLPPVLGGLGTCLDTEGVERIANIVEPLTLFGPEHVAGVLYNWAPLERLITLGRDAEARAAVERFIELNRAPHVREAMGEANWRSQYGGLLFMRSLYDAYAFGDVALRGVEELEQVGFRVWEMAADQVRLLYHAYRGESEDVQRYRERVELFAVQGSTTWQAEMFWPAILLGADVLAGDAIAARRTAEQLARRAKDLPVLQKFADAAQAAHYLLRGDIPRALTLYEKILPEYPLRGRVIYERTWFQYAQALNLAGEHARARALMLELISAMAKPDHTTVVYLEGYRQLALAEAGLGNPTEALRILDELLAEYGHHDNRLVIGLLHKARAEVALGTGDAAAFELHAREMERRFRSTRNPALIAQCERLLDRAGRLGVIKLEPLAAADGDAINEFGTVTSGISELKQAIDPCAHALKLVQARTSATSAYLYLRRHGAMSLAAASAADVPPRAVEDALQTLADNPPFLLGRTEQGPGTQPLTSLHSSMSTASSTTGTSQLTGQSVTGGSVSKLSDDDDEIDETKLISEERGVTVFKRSERPPNPLDRYKLVLLDAREGEGRVVIGGFILEAGARQVARLSKELLEGLAQVLHDRRVTTVLESRGAGTGA